MDDAVNAMLLDESVGLTLQELCAACHVTEDFVVEIVAEGIVEPLGAERAQWRFPGPAVARVERVIRLQREFDVNLPGAALALDLLEEVERLRRALRLSG
jgi:chaperone modulatory protein CbpM